MTSGTWRRKAASSKQASRSVRRQPLGDRRIDREQVAQRRALVGGAERGALDDRVGVLARHPAALDERAEDAAAGVQAEPALDVLAHPLAADDEPLDEPGHPHEQVVEDDRRVGQDHPLGARVADVALVPERLVLERGLGVAAEQAGEAGDPLGQDRVALVGHRARALLAGLERLHDLADLGVLEVPDLGREPLQRAAEDGDRRQQRGVPVALDDLGARRVGVEAELGEDLGLDVRARGGCTSRPVPRSCRSRSRRRRSRAGAGRDRPRTPSRRA